MTQHNTDAEAILEAGKELGASQIVNTPHGEFIVRPNNTTVIDLEGEYGPRPRRLAQFVDVHTADAFANYLALFGRPDQTVVFADVQTPREKRRVVAVIDYHKRDTPEFATHRCLFTLQYSRPFAAWLTNHQNKLSQTAFAAFLDDHMTEIVTPAGAVMQDVCLNFAANKSIEYRSTKRLADGSTEFTYNETVDNAPVNGRMKMPPAMKLQMPIFADGALVQLDAKIRYRVDAEGKLTLWYELEQVDMVIEKAVGAVMTTLEAAVASHCRGVIYGDEPDNDE